MIEKFIAALRFFTIIPIPGNRGTSEESLSGSLNYFSLVGTAIGLVMAAGGWLAWQFFPPWVAAVISVFLLLAVSGGLHLDGLADSADGFFSARPKERVLEIMRDSHIGVMGVIAIVMVLLMKSVCLANMSAGRAVAALFLMPLAGRSVMVFSMAFLPYVRKDGGIGTLFYKDLAVLRQATLWTGAIFYAGAWYAAGLAGIVAGAAALFAVLIFALYCRHKIGGATGDTLGASCEIAEVLVAVALVSFM